MILNFNPHVNVIPRELALHLLSPMILDVLPVHSAFCWITNGTGSKSGQKPEDWGSLDQ